MRRPADPAGTSGFHSSFLATARGASSHAGCLCYITGRQSLLDKCCSIEVGAALVQVLHQQPFVHCHCITLLKHSCCLPGCHLSCSCLIFLLHSASGSVAASNTAACMDAFIEAKLKTPACTTRVSQAALLCSCAHGTAAWLAITPAQQLR